MKAQCVTDRYAERPACNVQPRRHSRRGEARLRAHRQPQQPRDTLTVPASFSHKDRPSEKKRQMTTPEPHPEPINLPVDAITPVTVTRPQGNLERRHERTAARKRHVLAQCLPRTAKRSQQPDPISRRQTPLHHRAPAVHSELLEIATMLEGTHDPDPASTAEPPQPGSPTAATARFTTRTFTSRSLAQPFGASAPDS